MAETPNRAGPTVLSTSAAVILTAGAAATWMIVREITIPNVTATPLNVTVGVDSTSGAIADTLAKQLFSAVTVQPGSTLTISGFKLVLLGHATTPDRIYAFCSSASGANIYIPYVSGP